jgi:hypothetical protein
MVLLEEDRQMVSLDDEETHIVLWDDTLEFPHVWS